MTRREWTRAIPKAHRALMLRTCAADGTSHGGFVWPAKGYVEAPDWSPEPECGGGLHGALRGEGDGSLFRWDADDLWQVVEVDDREVVDLEGKVKVPRGWVVYTGDRPTATAMVADAHPGAVVIGATATAGRRELSAAGYGGAAAAGHSGTAIAGAHGTATAGHGGTASAGIFGTASAGNFGTATAGARGTATAGHGGTATAGAHGTATAGNDGTICILWLDGATDRGRLAVGYIGEDGLQPNTPYRFDAIKQRFVEAPRP